MLLLIHGGAGEKRSTKKALDKLYEALSSGVEILKNGGTAIDAVVKSITILEDSGLFNAGLGANLQFDGIRRLDASIMDGRDLKAGSVIGIEGIKNPIKLARILMDMPNIMMTNIGAKRIADVNKLEPLPETDKKSMEMLEKIKAKEKEMSRIYNEYFSTVGSVALDKYGNLSAGTSTGGITAMLPGRVGDTPIIGAGTYADNSLGAVSCTGSGEYIIRLSLAKEVCMNIKNMTPLKSALSSLSRLSKIGGKGGLIVINKKGQFALVHSTRYMASGYANENEVVVKVAFNKV